MKLQQFVSFNGHLYDGSTLADTLDLRQKAAECYSEKCRLVAGSEKRAKTVIPHLYRLILGMNGIGDRPISTASNPTYGYAEVKNPDGTMQVALCDVSNKRNITFYAASVTVSGAWQEYGSHVGTALLAAWIAWAIQYESEIKCTLDLLNRELLADGNDPKWGEELGHNIMISLGIISSNIYYSFTGEEYVLTDKPLARLRPERISHLNLIECNNAPALVETVSTQQRPTMGQYNLNPSRVLTADEAALIPRISPNFQWEPWHFTVAQDICDSQRFQEPYSVIMLGGPSGTGKSQGAAAIAYLLGRPRVIFTCDPDTDEFKLVGSTMPNTETEKPSIPSDLPSFDDVEFNFSETYKKLFGKEPGKYAEPSDCYKEINRRMIENVLEKKEKDFHFVKSEIIKALEYGWVVEVQEPTIIKRASVLVALNALLDNDLNSAMITLPTGETIKRHPEAVVIYTTNSDYAGCQAIQQSVLSRIDSIREIDLPSIDVLCNRTVSNTGWQDVKALKKMAKMIQDLNRYCQERDIRDGVCGTRELQSWAKKALMLQKRTMGTNEKEMPAEFIVQAAFSTILSHVSQEKEDQEDCITAEFKKIYGETAVRDARDAYTRGIC